VSDWELALSADRPREAVARHFWKWFGRPKVIRTWALRPMAHAVHVVNWSPVLSWLLRRAAWRSFLLELVSCGRGDFKVGIASRCLFPAPSWWVLSASPSMFPAISIGMSWQSGKGESKANYCRSHAGRKSGLTEFVRTEMRLRLLRFSRQRNCENPRNRNQTWRKISLDPPRALAYLPATLDRNTWATRAVRHTVADRQGPHLERTPLASVSADHRVTKLAWMPRNHSEPLQSQTARHTRMCRRTVQSLPEPPASAAPLGSVVFGGFFCALVAQAVRW